MGRFGLGIALYCVQRVGNYLENFEVIDLVDNIASIKVLGHAESKSGPHFVLRAMIHCLWAVFYPKFRSIC